MSIIKYIKNLCIILISIIPLYGCVSLPSSDNKKTSEIKVTLISDPNINEDVLGIPSPIRLTLLQLSSEIQFRQMSQLVDNDKSYKEILGESVLDKIHVMLRPDELLEFKLPINDKTKYLGLVTAYRDESNDWKQSLQKQDKRWYQIGDNHFLYLHIQPQGVVQLSKQEALIKILAFKLKEQGKSMEDFEKLTQYEQDKALKKLQKILEEESTPADISKGYFTSIKPNTEVIDILGDRKTDTDKTDTNKTDTNKTDIDKV